MKDRALQDSWKTTLLVAAVIAIAFYFLSLSYTSQTPRGVPPDERSHITYIHEASTSRHLMPDYRNSRILPERVVSNQLKHPPLYYSILGATARLLDLDAYEDFRVFRAINSAFVALALALWVFTARLLGFNLLQSIPLVLSVVALPMFPYLAGSINNDNFAYLAASVAFLGLASIRSLPRACWYIGAAGLGTALLTKATVGLFLALLFGLWCAFALIRQPQRLAHRHFAIAMATLVLFVGSYYLFTYTTHGTLFPSARPPRSGPQISEPMGLFAFTWEFGKLMLQHLPMVVNHATTAPLGSIAKAFSLASVALPFLGLLLANFSARRNDALHVANLMVVAFALTLAVHVMVSWEAYLELGQIRATQPRYYFYLVPAIAAFSFSGLSESRRLRVAYRTFAAIVLAAIAIVPISTISTERRQHADPESIRFAPPPLSQARLYQIDMSDGMVGSVGPPSRSADAVFIRGWAVDAESLHPAAAVEIYYDGRWLASVRPNRPRADVAIALGDADARNSGFEVMLEDVPPAISPCEFRYVAVQDSGRRVALPSPTAGCD